MTKGIRYSAHMFRERAAELTNEPAGKWLRENGHEKFFMWVHYFDPHATYLPPEPFRTEYAHNLYDGEIAYADSQTGVLLQQLEELGVRHNTLVIYTSDHGEGLGEHGE
ncbi:MAG: sulfatase-like hydrolase/transferase, partial [Gemmatimonadales bacterium]|nr:sulfatase-like hydrolase/transferase [Gemmatimonadales bacterium]